jgi:zinc transporter 1
MKDIHKYAILIAAVGVFFIIELVVGIVANSITLQADAYHMLSDLLALIIGGFALHISDKKNDRYTYGYVRAEIVAGLVNSVFLLSISFTMTIEIIEKLTELAQNTSNIQLSENIDTVLIVAVIGLIINVIGLGMFSHSHHHDHDHDEIENYARTAVVLHIIGDLLGSILVIVSSVIIKLVGAPWKYYCDPIGSIFIIIFIVGSSSKLLWKCIKILMHRWSSKQILTIKQEILEISEINSIHEFHVWDLDNSITIASMHIVLSDQVTSLSEIINTVKCILHKYEIHSSSIEPEWTAECSEPACSPDCSGKKCCSAV